MCLSPSYSFKNWITFDIILINIEKGMLKIVLGKWRGLNILWFNRSHTLLWIDITFSRLSLALKKRQIPYEGGSCLWWIHTSYRSESSFNCLVVQTNVIVCWNHPNPFKNGITFVIGSRKRNVNEGFFCKRWVHITDVLVIYILMTAKYLQHCVIPGGHPSKY